MPIHHKSLDEIFDSSDQPLLPKGKNYLVAIAIDEYEHCPRLYNTVKDATDLIEVLTTQYDFEPTNVIRLFNAEATESKILHTFRDIARTVTPSDNLLLFFSGHGEYDKIFKEGYWIPINARQGAYEDYISNSKIRTVLNAIHSHHTFLIVDSCFSGTLFTQYRSAAATERLEKDPSRWGLTAGRNEIVADGQPGTNSPFADSLIYQLRNSTKPIGVAELCNKVIEVVLANADQTPRGEPLKVEGHRGGQLFFYPKVAQNTYATAPKPKIHNRRGNILYNIPGQMECGLDTRCEVRIAFDKETLLHDLPELKDAKIKDIRISNLMEVDLVDPSGRGNDAFEIRQITQKEQFIDDDDYTQWIFYIKPLKNGKYPLILKVSVIEFLHGKERKREIVLEEMVQIVAEAPALAEVGTGYKVANYAFMVGGHSASNEQASPGTSVVPPPPMVEDLDYIRNQPQPAPSHSKPSMVKVLSGMAGMVAIAVAAIFLLPKMSSKPESLVNHNPTEEVDTGTPSTEGQINVPILEVEKAAEIPASPNSPEVQKRKEETDWENIKDSRKTTDFQQFIKTHPDGKYVKEAQEKITALNKKSISKGSITDARDQKKYTWVRINGKTWMTKNMNLEVENSWCYENDPANCEKYGRFYSWEAAQEICPAGWHLTTNEEWRGMINKNGGAKSALPKLLENSGLNVLLAGERGTRDNWGNLGRAAKYWTSTQIDGESAYAVGFYDMAGLFPVSYRNESKANYGICRCVKDQ